MKKTYLANLMTGNVLLHNLHWNVQGKAFKQIHEYLEFLYDDAFAKYDEVAERMKMDGVMPSASMKEYLAQTDMTELEVRDYSIEEALQESKKYLVHMRELALKIRTETQDKDEFAWVNLMEDHIAGYDKQIWFMNQTLVS